MNIFDAVKKKVDLIESLTKEMNAFNDSTNTLLEGFQPKQGEPRRALGDNPNGKILPIDDQSIEARKKENEAIGKALYSLRK